MLTCDGSETACTSCIEGYFLNKEKSECEPCPANCLYCSSGTNCTTCNNTYYPVNGLCKDCHESCEYCHDDTNACDECREKFYINKDKRCLSCPTHCHRCNSTYFFICEKDIYSVDGVCTPCADVCSHCITCIEGFLFDGVSSCNKKCSPDCHQCDKSCFNCTAAGNTNCITCNTGYVMNDDKICERLHESYDGNRCEMDHTNSTTYENYTLDATVVPSFV